MISVDRFAKNSFWYLDTNAGTTNTNTGFEARRVLTQAAKSINVIIPLNRYSCFEELEDKMLPPMQLQFELILNFDDELIHKAAADDDGRVVVTSFYLWLPRMTPKDSLYDEFVKDFMKPSRWVYMKDLYKISPNTKNPENTFQISPAIDKVKNVFIYLQRTKGPNNKESERSPYIFYTFKLNAANNNSSLARCRLEYGDNIFYPALEYNANSKGRIFNELMSYAYRKNDFNMGTQLNPHNFASLFGLIYFDLTYQKEAITQDPKQLFFTLRIERGSSS